MIKTPRNKKDIISYNNFMILCPTSHQLVTSGSYLADHLTLGFMFTGTQSGYIVNGSFARAMLKLRV